MPIPIRPKKNDAMSRFVSIAVSPSIRRTIQPSGAAAGGAGLRARSARVAAEVEHRRSAGAVAHHTLGSAFLITAVATFFVSPRFVDGLEGPGKRVVLRGRLPHGAGVLVAREHAE